MENRFEMIYENDIRQNLRTHADTPLNYFYSYNTQQQERGSVVEHVVEGES